MYEMTEKSMRILRNYGRNILKPYVERKDVIIDNSISQVAYDFLRCKS